MPSPQKRPSPGRKASPSKAKTPAVKPKPKAQLDDLDDDEPGTGPKKKISVIHCKGDWRGRVDAAIYHKQDFYYTATSSTIVIRQHRCRYVYNQTGDKYNFKNFHLFAQIRREVLKNIEKKGLHVPIIRSSDIDYYAFAQELYQVKDKKDIPDVWELDINMAYYNAAYALGYISKEFYEKCKTLDKKVRLRLIGSIAILKTKFIYRHGRLDDVQTVSNPLLRSAWFHICRYVADAMRDMAKILGKDFMFFWVDGIVFRGKEHLDVVHDFAFCKYGFDFKLLPMEKLSIEKGLDGIVKINVHGDKDIRNVRQFTLDTKRQERALAMIKEVNKLLPVGKIRKKDLQFVQ